MEESVKEQQTSLGQVEVGKSKLRYPLRSAAKSKEEKPLADECFNSSVSKRGKQASSVSKSVSVLDLSRKDRSASTKPSRRLSIPAKSLINPSPRPAGSTTITPISEARVKRQANTQGKVETPVSDVSRASSRKKFSVLSSASYWLSQIKLSESAAKHSISLGFFKLALEAGCEPLQRMRDELRLYIGRNEIREDGDAVKDLLESYNVLDNQDQVQVSETCSQVPEGGIRSSDDEVHSSSSTVGTRKLRPRSLNADNPKVTAIKESAKKGSAQQNTTTSRTRGPMNKNSANVRTISVAGEQKPQKPQKPSKQEVKEEKVRKQGARLPAEEDPVSATAAPEENKENVDDLQMEEIIPTEVC